MLRIGIADVDHATLQALVENRVPEGKTIEYKRKLPGRSDGDVVPLLGAAASFANTAGGDLLLGVETKDGIPVELPGIEIASVDREILRLEHVLLNGLEPRVPRPELGPVEVATGRYVLIIRIPRSWVGPHRVQKNSKFYARTSAGRYELDVGELRAAFTASEAIPTRIRDFRTERLARIHSRETPVPLIE